jgi:integrase
MDDPMPKLSERYDLTSRHERSKLACLPGRRFTRYLDDAGNSLYLKCTQGGKRSFVYYARPFKGADAEERELGLETRETTPMEVSQIRVTAAKMEHVRRVEGRNPFVVAKRMVPDLKTINDLVNQYKGKHAGRTLESINDMFRDLLARHGKTRLVDFTSDELEDFLNRNHQHRPCSAILMLDYLNAAYHCAGDRKTPRRVPDGVIDPATGHNATWNLKTDIGWIADYRPGSYKVNWTDEEWDALMEGFRRTYELASVSCINVLMLELMVRTGARPGEIQNLRWDQVSTLRTKGPDGATIFYRSLRLKEHKNKRKISEDRIIRLDAAGSLVLDRAKAAAATVGYEGTRVFFAPRKKQRDLDKAPSLLGGLRTLKHYMPVQIAGLTPYNFRSAYINIAGDLLGPASEALVSKLVGHTTVQTTEKYYRDRGEPLLVGVVNAVGAKLAPVDYSPKRPKMRFTRGSRQNIAE